MGAAPTPLTPQVVLDLIPQKPPFRFVDRVIEIDDQHALCEATYSPEAFFYAGHFPGDPVTPGVILIETMGQTANALMVYLLGLEHGAEGVRKLKGAGTDVSIEFESIVLPGETVNVRAEKMFWRGRKLKSKVELWLAQGGNLVAHGTIGGIVVDERRGPASRV